MKDNLIVLFIIIVIPTIISVLMATCIDDMHTNHKDYKGEDFLN